MDRKVRIAVLWLMVMLGGLVHTIVEIMPIFWGDNVAAMPQNEAQMHGMMIFSACFFLTLPALGELCTLYGCRRWATIANAVLAGLMLLLNTAHPIMDLAGAPIAQWFILPVVFALNLLLFIDALKVCRNNCQGRIAVRVV